MTELLKMVPARARQITYAVLAAALFGYGLWEASNGDWKTFVLGLVGAISSEMARQNVTVPEPAPTYTNFVLSEPTPTSPEK